MIFNWQKSRKEDNLNRANNEVLTICDVITLNLAFLFDFHRYIGYYAFKLEIMKQ